MTTDQLHDIENGLGSAIAIFDECQIIVPEGHPDPKAIVDCKNNVRDAYDLVKRLKPENPIAFAEWLKENYETVWLEDKGNVWMDTNDKHYTTKDLYNKWLKEIG